MTTRCIIALAACLLGTQAFAQTPVQQFNAKTAPAVKTFAQKTPEPIVAETLAVEQKTSEKPAPQVNQDVEIPLHIEYSAKVDGTVLLKGEGGTLLKSAFLIGTEVERRMPSCTFELEDRNLDVSGAQPVNGIKVVISTTKLVEDGVTALVNVTVKKGATQGVQELWPGCVVAEGKDMVEITSRVVTLTWDSPVTITTDTGAEVQITLKHDKNEKPVVATEST